MDSDSDSDFDSNAVVAWKHVSDAGHAAKQIVDVHDLNLQGGRNGARHCWSLLGGEAGCFVWRSRKYHSPVTRVMVHASTPMSQAPGFFHLVTGACRRRSHVRR